MALSNKESQKVQRNLPAHRREAVTSALGTVWGDGALVNPALGDELGQVMDGALNAASDVVKPLHVRREEAHAQRAKARTPAGLAAARLLTAEQDESAERKQSTSELDAQAKAMVAGWDEADMEAIKNAIIDKQVEESPGFSLEDEPPAWVEDAWANEQAETEAQEARAARQRAEAVEAVGFDWEDVPVDEVGDQWQFEDEAEVEA